MDIKWVKTFIVAANYENFRMASEDLYLAQPTVTLHIKNLEEELGLQLFDRKGRHVYITPIGQRFLPHAKKILESYESGIHDIEERRQGEGLGVSFLPRSIIQQEVEEGQLRISSTKSLSLPITATYFISKVDSPEVKLFKSYLQI
jgi:DNA-binding transcriptional LysR family regulator